MEKLKSLEAKQQKTRSNVVFLTIAALSMICVAGSLLIQFKAHYKPCSLCSAQRFICLGLAALSLTGCFGKFEWLIRKILFCVLCLGLIIALYQSLAYFRLITIKCSIDPANLLSLVNSQKVRASSNCIDQLFTVFGIPPSLISMTIFIFNGWLLFRSRFFIVLHKGSFSRGN